MIVFESFVEDCVFKIFVEIVVNIFFEIVVRIVVKIVVKTVVKMFANIIITVLNASPSASFVSISDSFFA